MSSNCLFGITNDKSPAVAFKVGLRKDFFILLSDDLLPFTRSPNLCINTPPPSIFETLAIDSPYSFESLNGSVNLFVTKSAKFVFSVLSSGFA